MTFLELCVKLRERVASQGSGPASTVGQAGINLRIVNWINEAYAEIQRKWTDWRFRWYEGTLTTTTGVAAISMPAAIAGWYKDCFYYDGSNIPVMEWEQYRLERDSWDDADDDEPSFIVIKPDNSLILLPAPAAVYNIRYEGYAVIDELSGNADTPILPAECHMTIVYKAMEYYGVHHDAPEVIAEGRELYTKAMIALESSQLPGMEYRSQAVGNNLQIVS